MNFLEEKFMYTTPTVIKKISANLDGRDFVVGDLHGCFDELGKLLEHVKFDPNQDRLFCTGDLIDRGPKSLDCLSLLSKKWFFSVLGNHEDLLLIKLKMIEVGQTQALKSDEIDYIKSLNKYVPEILKLPLVYEIEHLLLEKVYITHSEVLPEHLHVFSDQEIGNNEYERFIKTMKIYDFSPQINTFFQSYYDKLIEYPLKQKLLWSRKIVSNFYKDNKNMIDKGDFSFIDDHKFEPKYKIFCGHNVVPFPMRIGQQYYIDTGAALGHSSKEINSNLFSQFGHEFFTLSMVDITTGICYGCISSNQNRNNILKLEKPLYKIDLE